MRLASTLLLALGLAACTGPGTGGAGTPPDASSPPSAAGAEAATPAPANAPRGAAAPSDADLTVKNPLGKEMPASKHASPAEGSVEHTLLVALQHQAGNGDFDGFLAFIHPSAKQEPTQKDRLKAYNYESSKGAKAAACVHDGALITTGRKEVNATVAGGGDVGTKVMVWCGDKRMPVPFTLYPDGEVQRVTVWGLN